jgi:hypothetical protein
MFIDVYVTKGIDASFVSAFADIALVVFAVVAFHQAKRVWIDKTKHDGYKVALDLLNGKLHEVRQRIQGVTIDLNLTHGKLSSVDSLISEWRNTIPEQNSAERIITSFEQRTNSISNQLDKVVNPLREEIEYDIFRLKNMSVRFSDNVQGAKLHEYFIDYLKLYEVCKQLHSQLINFEIYYQSELTSFEMIPDLATKITEMIDTNNEAMELIKKIKINHRIIIKDEHSNLLSYFDFT